MESFRETEFGRLDIDAVKPIEACVEVRNVVLVDENQLLEAQYCLAGCESCDENASVTFDYLLDAVTGCDPTTTDYVMCRTAKCPNCLHVVNEKTRIVTR